MLPFEIIETAGALFKGAIEGEGVEAALFKDFFSSQSGLSNEIVGSNRDLEAATKFLEDARLRLAPPGKVMIDSALITQDERIINGLASYYKLPAGERDLLTDADWSALQQQLNENTPEAVAKAASTLEAITSLLPAAESKPSINEILGLSKWIPPVRMTERDLG